MNTQVLTTQTEYTLASILEHTFHELAIKKDSECQIDSLRVFTKNSADNNDPQAETMVILENYADHHEYHYNAELGLSEKKHKEQYDEGYTDYVIKNNLELLYDGQLFIDVLSVYKDYRHDINIPLMIKSLEYYSEHDCFLEITDDM